MAAVVSGVLRKLGALFGRPAEALTLHFLPSTLVVGRVSIELGCSCMLF